MSRLKIEHIAKSFATTDAVKDISFTVEPGEIFGMLGPNGAGKTTTIRMILDIIKPDRGTIEVLGGPMSEEKQNRIGYLPEERGLYRNLRVLDCMTYLGTLKGLERGEARRRSLAYLERVDLAAQASKKVSELSKGMQQKVQFGTTIVHEPELVIIDEPFAALDPVNTRLIKDLIYEMRAAGRAIVMSTHQMHLVEEMCDRLVMFNRGQIVLSGTLREVKRRFSPNAVRVEGSADFQAVPGVRELTPENGAVRLALEPGTRPQEVLRQLVAQPDSSIERFEVALPSLDEIFVRVAGGERAEA